MVRPLVPTRAITGTLSTTFGSVCCSSISEVGRTNTSVWPPKCTVLLATSIFADIPPGTPEIVIVPGFNKAKAPFLITPVP